MDFDIIELADLSGEMAHIYSVTLKGDELTLLEQFIVSILIAQQYSLVLEDISRQT